jgi:hypothetical protein
MRDWSRRDYLRAAAGGAAGVTAGCSLPANPLTGDDRTGTYLDWLPDPERLGVDPYAVVFAKPRDAHDHADALHPATRRIVGRRWLPDPPGFRDALGRPREQFGFLQSTSVYREVPADDPAGALEDLGYREAETRGDFVVMEWDRLASDLEDAPEVAAVGADAVVVGAGSRSFVEATVDAYRGTGQRLHERAPGVKTAARDVGARTFTRLDAAADRETPPGVVAEAGGWELAGDEARFRTALRFEDQADARVADVRSPVGGRWLEECRDVGVERDEATVSVSARTDVATFDFRHAGTPGGDGIPDAAFALERDLADIVATHAGDQPVPVAELEVALYTGVRLESRELTRSLTDRQFDDEYDVVRQGDSMAFRPETNGRVQVEWVHPEADDRLALAATWFDA